MILKILCSHTVVCVVTLMIEFFLIEYVFLILVFTVLPYLENDERVHDELHMALFPSNRPPCPLHLEAESDCFEMGRNISTTASASRMLPWKLCKNWVAHMQSNFMHICVCLFPFVFSLDSDTTVSVATLNQSVIWYLFVKMTIDIVIESSVLSDP